MPACANCARELRPEWKFCVSCGMPTGVTAARPETKAIPIITPEVAAAAARAVATLPEPVAQLPQPVPAAQPVAAAHEPIFAALSQPAAQPVPASVTPVLAPEPVLEAASEAVQPTAVAPTALATDLAPTATLLVTPPEPDPSSAPISLRTGSGRPSSGRPRRRGVNALAVVALVLGCLASPLAALFGHLALAQLTASGQRGRIPAIIAIVLGYGSLAFIIGLAVIYLTSHA
jgi:hypothetical protein